MKVHIVEPCMQMLDIKNYNVFNNMIIQQLTEYGVEYCVINNKNISRNRLQLSDETLVIVYNEHSISKKDNREIQSFLNKAMEMKAEIWPIAMDKANRSPIGIISERQSYDVWEQLRCRNLDEQYLSTIARIFARKIISRVFPTCYCESGEIFLSHRRIDGEEITARIYDKMIIQARESSLFRDVVNVNVGEAAQKVIDSKMENSDVFVFIHTPESIKSDWILKELMFALLRNIPILWIQIDNADIKKLRVKPSDEPHLKYKTEDFDDEKQLTKIVDLILQKAFELVMDKSNQIFGYIEMIENMFGDKLSTTDNQKMIYHVSIKRKGYHYPQRNIEQYYQIFGRTPTIEDAKKLEEELKSIDADSIVILTNRVVTYKKRENVIFDSIEDFYYHWSMYMDDEKKKDEKIEIVISGAFPDCDEIYKQSLTDALIMFAKVIIRNGYELTFGSHPTFQELFYEVAREIEPKNYKDKVNMYISQWFLEREPEKEKEYREKYTLCKVEKKCELSLSLSNMRERMIQRENVKALICLGGKIKKNKEEEGIREEIRLARECNIPVFVVGSVGGCSSKVAVECKKIGWNKINNATNELNQNFLESIDYFSMAQEMVRFLNSKESK